VNEDGEIYLTDFKTKRLTVEQNRFSVELSSEGQAAFTFSLPLLLRPGAAFDDAVFDDAVFDDADFDDADFDDTVFDNAVLDDAAFDDATFDDAVTGADSLSAAAVFFAGFRSDPERRVGARFRSGFPPALRRTAGLRDFPFFSGFASAAVSGSIWSRFYETVSAEQNLRIKQKWVKFKFVIMTL
jgi:hypothetical protein